jgi:menaquinone-dependent protoporphyrinogen oxidase
MNVLIVYGSKMGGTAGLARMLGEALERHGASVDVEPALEADAVEDYAAVVVGSALYAGRWQRDARRFVKKNTAVLSTRPVFFFSSGPLDDSAKEHEIPPTKQVLRLMNRVGTSEHTTFGGRLAADAPGFMAGAMAKEHAGDWRDPAQVEAWAHHVASRLRHDVVA